MAKKKTDPLKDSCNFVFRNLDITTDQLSDELLDYWSVKDESDTENQFSVFLCAYTLYTTRKQGHGNVTLDVEKLDKLFENFQAIISLEKLSRQIPINNEKKKIFDFDSYDGTFQLDIDKENVALVENIIKATLKNQ